MLLIVAGFGWGKPVQIDPRNFDGKYSLSKAEAIVAAVFLLTWMFNKRKASNRTIAALVLVLGVASVFAFGIDDVILESFSITGDKGSSTIARLNSVAYYTECFIQNPFCGFGFTNDASIINGPTGYSWPSDVGLIGQLAKIGLFVIPIYFVIIIRFLFIFFDKQISHECKMLAGINLIYLIMSSGSLIILDSERAILTPIIVSSVNAFYREECNGK